MTIDWIAFTPWSALAGGLMIGLAAASFILLNGRIAGISGVLGGLLRAGPGDRAWRLAFLAGMLAAPLLARWTGQLVPVHIDADIGTLVLAGVLVGLGTRYGSGCSSGHGVCGLSRLSPRSLVATVCFIGAGMVTVFMIRRFLGA
ncbi:YeeE/YedE family protein [Castellaniella sp.]|uniref:YeeE/YedE family protein n=1 Tax=Castellaniella sp. TaxID=1955812 RepID=UPI002AFEBC81|nr:YeeE/YedE family protein [Castellaniella sp.]